MYIKLLLFLLVIYSSSIMAESSVIFLDEGGSNHGGCLQLLIEVSSGNINRHESTWQMSSERVDNILGRGDPQNLWGYYIPRDYPGNNSREKKDFLFQLFSEQSNQTRHIVASIILRMGGPSSQSGNTIISRIIDLLTSGNLNALEELQREVFTRNTELARAMTRALRRNSDGIEIQVYNADGTLSQVTVTAFNAASGLVIIRKTDRLLELPLGDLYSIASEASLRANHLPEIEGWGASDFVANRYRIQWEILEDSDGVTFIRADDDFDLSRVFRLVIENESNQQEVDRIMDGERRSNIRNQIMNFGILQRLGMQHHARTNITRLVSPRLINQSLELWNHPMAPRIRFETVGARIDIPHLFFGRIRSRGLRPIGVGGLRYHDYIVHLLEVLAIPNKAQRILSKKYELLFQLYDDQVLSLNQNFKEFIDLTIARLVSDEDNLSFKGILWRDVAQRFSAQIESNYISGPEKLGKLTHQGAQNFGERLLDSGGGFVIPRTTSAPARQASLTPAEAQRFRRIVSSFSNESMSEEEIWQVLASPEYRNMLLSFPQ